MAAQVHVAPPIALAVIPDVPATPKNKRTITPSANSSSPKRVLVLVSPNFKPAGLSRDGTLSIDRCNLTPRPPVQLFPKRTAHVIEEYKHTHAHPEPMAPSQIAAWQTRHVLTPLNLKDSAVDPLEGEAWQMLRNIFPDTKGITVGRHTAYINFNLSKMPQPPWPITVGGIPITLEDGTNGRGPLFPRMMLGNLQLSICSEFNGQHSNLSVAELRRLTAEVFQTISSIPGVQLIEIMYTCESTFFLILNNAVDLFATRSQLPGKIAGCVASYLRDQELHRPAWSDYKARRQIVPQPITGVIDDTAYDVLRPGVILRSKRLRDHSHPDVLSTTAGVLVKNTTNDTFMTVAAHGVGENETVHQIRSGRPNRKLGQAVHEISFTDVTIVKLEDEIRFVNETFENSSGVVPRFVRLFGEDSQDELRRLRDSYNTVYLDSPFSGHMDGTVVATSIKVQANPPEHPTEDNLRYVVYDWVWTGQSEGAGDTRTQLRDGTCGSAIWDDDGVILGFFHFEIKDGPWAGFMAAVSATEVVRAGYKLAT